MRPGAPSVRPGRASRPATVCLGVAALAVLAACTEPPVETQPCPTLSYARDVVYVLGGELPIAGDVSGELPTTGPRFRAHPLAVPAAGGVTVTLALAFEDGPPQPAVYAYGPRDTAGIFGTCSAQAVGTSLTVQVPEGGGGEWLVLVGADPLQDARGRYTLTAACEGDACDDPACPALLATSCATEVCPSGFATTATADGLTCPACTCEQPECGAFRTAVFDTCVCDCQVPLNPAPVCGSDGQTYTTACFAECAEVPVGRSQGACEDTCEPLQGCSLQCPGGYALDNGCPICACADPCAAVSSAWRPVCGTDGFTYVNAQRLACANAARAGGDAIAIAYLGPCLPNCPARTDCTTSCEWGHTPIVLNRKGEDTCFSCDCATAPVLQDDGGAQPQFCGFARRDGAASFSYPERLSLFRSFASADAARAQDFAPLFAEPCFTSGCTEDTDCANGAAVLATQATYTDGRPIGVTCVKGKIAGRVCRASVKAVCTTDADCATGGACLESADGETKKCVYECSCLSRQNANVYEPVCAMKDGAPTTYFNPCLANCQGAWPILYPGECCTTARLDNTARNTLFQSLAPICKAANATWVPRTFQETSCPPTLAECTAEPARCCHTDLFLGASE